MNVRNASFRDLGRIEQLFRETAAHEERQVVRPPGADSPVPQAALVRLWYGLTKTLSPLVPMSDSGTSLLVADDTDGTLLGFIQAQGVPGQPKAWHVTHLCTQPTARGHFAGAPLITSLMHQGQEHGVTRFIVSVPVDSPMLGLFVELGYTQYATEQILFRDDTEQSPRLVPDEGASSNLRPAKREDLGQIHLLYLRTTPSTVANVEGPTLKAWQSSYAQGWMTRIGRDDVRHFVYERTGVVAWAALRPASSVRPGLLALMCDGQDAQLRDEFVDAVLAQTPPGPLTCILRHYDSELIRALQSRGFAIFSTQLLLVRDLAMKVRVREVVPARKEKKGVLVPAGLARAVPSHSSARSLRSLNVAVNVVERSQPSSSLR
jgi:ribosomal protein S18 acetylase RimI-like enzyme